MRFAFTEQQLELRTAVRQVLDRECTTGDLRAIVDSHDHGAGRSANAGRCFPSWARRVSSSRRTTAGSG